MPIELVPFCVAVIINISIGMFWYSPKLMGKSWAAALGFDIKELNATPVYYVGAMVVTIVTVMITGLLVNRFQVDNFYEATKLGMLLWLGFIVTSHFSGVIWAKKPLKVYIIDVGFLFFTTMINTLLLALWKP